jgi:putative tryptophan/tyrosine transport system substrate-binding protein
VDAARLRAAAPLVGLFIALALLVGVPAEAQPPAKLVRIGFLSQASLTSPTYHAFLQGLRDLGWVEGKHFSIDHAVSDGQVERLPALAIDLVRQHVDVIVATALAVEAAKAATRTIPIVFVMGDDPVGVGLVPSLARPGGNMTGFTTLSYDLEGKRLALLKEAFPTLKRLAVLINPDLPGSTKTRVSVERGAGALGFQPRIVQVRSDRDFDAAISGVPRTDALLIVGSAFFFNHHARLAELTTRSRVATIAPWRQFAESGGLMSYGADVPDLFRRAADYVARIVNGAKPGDLPIQQASKLEMFINLKTAKALGLTIPQQVILRADQVIE